jgi:hypothetical protein
VGRRAKEGGSEGGERDRELSHKRRIVSAYAWAVLVLTICQILLTPFPSLPPSLLLLRTSNPLPLPPSFPPALFPSLPLKVLLARLPTRQLPLRPTQTSLHRPQNRADLPRERGDPRPI